jgi:hypothetical protein
MPRGPKGEKRPADVNVRAVLIAKIGTGEPRRRRQRGHARGERDEWPDRGLFAPDLLVRHVTVAATSGRLRSGGGEASCG